MQVGKKGTGQEVLGKMLVTRHGNGAKSGGKRTANACEKVYEVRVRRAGKRACLERE